MGLEGHDRRMLNPRAGTRLGAGLIGYMMHVVGVIVTMIIFVFRTLPFLARAVARDRHMTFSSL